MGCFVVLTLVYLGLRRIFCRTSFALLAEFALVDFLRIRFVNLVLAMNSEMIAEVTDFELSARDGWLGQGAVDPSPQRSAVAVAACMSLLLESPR